VNPERYHDQKIEQCEHHGGWQHKGKIIFKERKVAEIPEENGQRECAHQDQKIDQAENHIW
jgi:hypothetical protein